MVIANHPAMTGFIEVRQKNIMSLTGVKSVFISPRLLDDSDHRGKIHFHWLNKDKHNRDGLADAINRFSYRAKLDQKIDGIKRTFDGSRKLKPLQPLSVSLETKQINQLSNVA
jgi:DNA polymerase II large subunit